jgi:hypothetical protein
MIEEQDAYEMTNLLPRHTGLAMMIWVSPRGFIISDLAPDDPHVITWAQLNRSALRDFWNDGDAYRLLARLRAIS